MVEPATFLGLTQDNWTLIGAGIAAATGLTNFAWQWLDRHDRITVRCGSLNETIDPYNSLFVVNEGQHSAYLHDYGLILANHQLMSLPWALESGRPFSDDLNSYTVGERAIAPHATFEAGLEYRGHIVGAWVRSATQRRPRLAFSRDTPIWRRIWLTVRHTIKPIYC